MDDLIMFDGTGFLPNVFAVSSWVEYEGLATVMWVCKDLCWWASVEKEIPGLDILTCVVGAVHVSHVSG